MQTNIDYLNQLQLGGRHKYIIGSVNVMAQIYSEISKLVLIKILKPGPKRCMLKWGLVSKWAYHNHHTSYD